MIIYHRRGVPAESALPALQHFPRAEEFPLLPLRAILPREQHNPRLWHRGAAGFGDVSSDHSQINLVLWEQEDGEGGDLS